MVTVSPETVAVVAGLKSEYFTSGLEQPVRNGLKLRSRMAVNLFMVRSSQTSMSLASQAMIPNLPVESPWRSMPFAPIRSAMLRNMLVSGTFLAFTKRPD